MGVLGVPLSFSYPWKSLPFSGTVGAEGLGVLWVEEGRVDVSEGSSDFLV